MQLQDFLKKREIFRLGHLPTEGFHPLTKNLSNEILSDPSRAIDLLNEVDHLALLTVLKQKHRIIELQKHIQNTWNTGGRVFLSGCGATGRLALVLERLVRQKYQNTPRENQIFGLMAGGDYALVKSVENFEDYPEYGKRHLQDLGFQANDLLIAITEGGETPYVIGTVWCALESSTRHPWFVFCNPKEILEKTVQRSKEIFDQPKVESLELNTGPMALSGSTRLQAATVQMLAVGAALLDDVDHLETWITHESRLPIDPTQIDQLSTWESQHYQQGNSVLYETHKDGLAVLTDTTERSPTFSLTAFEKTHETEGPFSWCYLGIPDFDDSETTWNHLLLRDPIGLEWPELKGRLGRSAIFEFDFSKAGIALRTQRNPVPHIPLQVSRNSNQIAFTTQNGPKLTVASDFLSHPLWCQIQLKRILNIHSLMVMAKMNRFQGNIMTWVKPSNGKLIDRTLRYALQLGVPGSEYEILERIFHHLPNLEPNQSILNRLLKGDL